MDSNFSIHQWRDQQVKDRVNEEFSEFKTLDDAIEFTLGYLQSFQIFVERLKDKGNKHKKRYEEALTWLKDLNEKLKEAHSNPEVEVDNMGNSAKYTSFVGKLIIGIHRFNRETGDKYEEFLTKFSDWLERFDMHMAYEGMYDHDNELGTDYDQRRREEDDYYTGEVNEDILDLTPAMRKAYDEIKTVYQKHVDKLPMNSNDDYNLKKQLCAFFKVD